MVAKNKFLGKSIHRLRDNPREKIFSDAWVEENKPANYPLKKYSLLEQLLSDDGGKTKAGVSDRDEMIAATVIQWLGSPVGFSWLRGVMRNLAAFESRDKR